MNCYKKILNTYDTLPRQKKKIADYILQNIKEVVFFSISTIAHELNVSESTIVRFTQFLGYKGFQDFKKDLVHYYLNYLTPGERLQNSIEILANGDYSVEKVLRFEIKCLQETVETINSSTVNLLIDSICSKPRIFVFGIGYSTEPLVRYLSLRLRKFGLDIRDVPDSGSNMMEHIPLIKKDDLIILIKFLKTTPEYLSLANALKTRGASSFLITDNKKTELVKTADNIITVSRGPASNYHTMTVPMAVASSIIFGVAEKMGKKAIDFISDVGKFRNDYYRDMYENYPQYAEKLKKVIDDEELY